MLIRALFLAPFLFLISACGFHLRGSQTWKHLQLQVVSSQKDCLFTALTRQLPHVETDKELLPTLVISHNQLTSSPLTYNSFNQVYQQRLSYEATFTLLSPNQEILIPETTVTSDREQRVTNTAPLSDQQERKMLEEALCQDVAQQLLWQITQQYAHQP